MMKTFCIVAFLLLTQLVYSKNIYTLSGSIKSLESQESLISATVWVNDLNIGTATDIDGNFELKIPEGDYTIRFSYLGFNDQKLKMYIRTDTFINILLSPGIELESVIIRSNKESRFNMNFGSLISITQADITNLPSIMGEPDVIKSLELLPGIKSGYESSTGLLVRGGNNDQNLILIDGAPVYNPSHMAGFLSAFNTDIVKSFEVYLGGFPAYYGNKVSSVIDIQTQNGDMEKHQLKGGIGLLTGRLTANGPIKKNRSSYLFSMRSFYSYSLTRGLAPQSLKEEMPLYNFYDGYGKIAFTPNKKNSFFLSGFSGGDKSGLRNISDIDTTFLNVFWFNHVISAQWKHTFSENTIGYLEVHNTFYNFDFEIKNSFDINKASARNLDNGIKYYLNFYPNDKHAMKTGVVFNYKHFQPNTVFKDIYLLDDYDLKDKSTPASLRSYMAALYFQDSWNIHEKLNINSGIRLHWYLSSRKNFVIPEPRISINYSVNKNLSIKAGYSYLAQFEHLLSNASISSPFDIWLQTNDTINPQLVHEVSLGAFTSFKNGGYEISLVGYYKNLKNQLGQIPGTNLFNINNQYNKIITFGEGDSYGFELYAKKMNGKLTGFLSYTLAWSNRLFETQNRGKPYPAQFDRRHDIAISGNYEINKKWSMSILFIFGSPNNITMPNGFYYQPSVFGFGSGNLNGQYTSKNNLRLSPYHRLDIGARYTIDKPKIKHVLRFDIYNLYNQANPLFILPQTVRGLNNGGRNFKITEFSIIPILPSIGWNFELK